ncbi:hypothetical protein C1645_880447 [Glomus cerebriforme]|uniref:Hsp70 protein n=1 Tax=Glomus cerebriforme TaxID=658196 RepID=A0A397SDC7_9GLOM|nr:hypothetical protein C1645_880447 [Glomus cerebriforme]
MDGKILVAIDFGIKYSSFAYVHKRNPENVVVNTSWPGQEGTPKVPTALLYDEEYKNVISWGKLALRNEQDEVDDIDEQRSPIEDYLTQMRKLIQKTLEKRWPTVKFPQQVDFVLTIPADWPLHTTKIMRECAYKAGLLTSLNSNQLEFTTEPKAAALYCLSAIKEHNLKPFDSFLVVDCGDETVDLTSRKLLPGNELGEVTERVNDLCGSTFVDKEFLQWLGRKVGFKALEKLKSNHYRQMQHLVQRFFCTRIKFKFNGDPTEYKTLKLNLQQYCPDLQQYVTDEPEKQMEKAGWVLKVDFDSVKEIFDPVINRIIKLFGNQLDNSSNEKCSAIFLVGEFSESTYLFRRIKETFKQI